MSVINSIRSQLAPIHPQGYPFVGSFALASIVLFWLWPPFGWLGTVVTLWCAYFFRDPPRVTPARAGVVVAPADGRISRIANASPPKELALGELAVEQNAALDAHLAECASCRATLGALEEQRRALRADSIRGEPDSCD